MIKLIVDTTCEIFPAEAKNLGIVSLPMRLIFDQTEYTPGVNLTNEEFYQKLKTSKQLPHTSQLNVQDYVEAIKPIIENNDEVFVMCISSKLSGSFNSLEQAQRELKTNQLEILNTKAVSFAYHMLVLEAIKLINQGISLKDLKIKMQEMCDKIEMFAIVDNVTYLIKGGRLSSTLGFLVKTLHIKPIVKIVDGELKVVAKAIGMTSARKALKNLITNINKNMPIILGHSNDFEKADVLCAYLEHELDVKICKKCEIGPIIGTHAGSGCVGVAYFKQ